MTVINSQFSDGSPDNYQFLATALGIIYLFQIE